MCFVSVGGSNATASSWGTANQAPPQQWGNSSPQQAPQQAQQPPQQPPPQHSREYFHIGEMSDNYRILNRFGFL